MSSLGTKQSVTPRHDNGILHHIIVENRVTPSLLIT